MQAEDKDKIIRVMKKVCKEEKNGDENFAILQEIYIHISQHENEPSDDMAQSIKNIIDSK